MESYGGLRTKVCWKFGTHKNGFVYSIKVVLVFLLPAFDQLYHDHVTFYSCPPHQRGMISVS